MLDTDYFLLQRIFEKAGLPLYPEGEKDHVLELHYRLNPDGSIRWVWPAGLKKPLFLKFYNTASPRARLIAIAARTLFQLNRFASGKIRCTVSAAAYGHFLQARDGQWALFAGTEGAHRSAVFYANQRFYKIPVGEEAHDLFVQEVKQLRRHQQRRYQTFEVPETTLRDGVLIQQDLSVEATRADQLTDLHWNVLTELSELNACRVTIGVLPEWKKLEQSWDRIRSYQDTRIPVSLLKRLQALKETIDPSLIIPASYAHGDFTPWNTFIRENKMGLIDWELANPCAPLLTDAFHFMYQQSTLVDQLPYPKLEERIRMAMEGEKASWLIDIHRLDWVLHHKLYLLFQITKYLDVYGRQVRWHPQVYMSLQTWSHAIDALLIQEGKASARQTLITGLFDLLHQKNYAVLKWGGGAPEWLSEQSDIDMAIEPGLRSLIQSFFKQHPLVSEVRESRKSFMSNFAVILQDGSFLSVDTIWKFKRRDLVMLNASELLRSRERNAWGLRVPSIRFDLEYTWLFYTLNHSAVPEKYQRQFTFHSKGLVQDTNQQFPWIQKLGLQSYRDLFQLSPQQGEAVRKMIEAQPVNCGWSRIKNRIHYWIDSVREHAFRKGAIITFSGVDGAGKSTIIENLATELEKKYRKKVVLLRHRPSLLPMLSAWTKGGRLAAETQAAQTLPRQGTNRNLLSSLIRFGYYYTDYLLGQLVVHVRYVWRGYWVVYDRYYFDFINDSRRSNIHLPGGFIRWWYGLLIKPRFNFFLYADEQVILKRKKELDGPTIRHLTDKYLRLFNQLGRRKGKAQYISIENNKLPDTLQKIRHSLQPTLL